MARGAKGTGSGAGLVGISVLAMLIVFVVAAGSLVAVDVGVGRSCKYTEFSKDLYSISMI